MPRLLISGVPASGKTTVARHLAAERGFTHVDMEADSFRARREVERDPEAFAAALSGHEALVVSWGFSPFIDRPGVDHLRERGFELIWLDGDRVASLRHFLEREASDPRQEANYYGQMQIIVSTELVERLRPLVVSPFSGGEFRPVGEIAAEILERLPRQRLEAEPD